MHWPRVPAAFRPPAFASQPSFPAWDSAPLTIGLPAPQRWTMTGFPRSAHARHGRNGRPLYPGTGGAHAGRCNPRPAACRITAAGSSTPAEPSPIRGYASRGISQGFTSFARPAFPSPVAPGRPGAPPAFPRAPHPRGQDPRTHARAGTGSEHKPGTTPLAYIRRPSNPRVHSHRVRPRVALARACPSALVVGTACSKSLSLACR